MLGCSSDIYRFGWWPFHCWHFEREIKRIAECKNGVPYGFKTGHNIYICCACHKLKEEYIID